MATKTFTPTVKVSLTKVVRRTGPDRVNREVRDIDLTDWLGESGSVVERRAVNSPARVTITLTDRMSSANEDTLYALIEPMDVLTVRIAREPHAYTQVPIRARAFVDKVRRTEIMGPDGKPVRAVVVEATDVIGKALQVVEIFHKKEYLLGNALLSSYPLFELGKVGFGQLLASEFVRRVVDVANAWLGDLSMRGAFDVPLHINVDASLVTRGKVGPYSIQAWQGTLWKFLMNWCDLAWNELLLEDREDGPWLTYRPKAYRSVDGKPTSLDPAMAAFHPAEIELSDAQVISMDLSRSDTNVANFYNVRAPQADMLLREQLDPYYLQKGSMFLGDSHPNCALSLYGLLKLEEPSGQLTDRYLVHPDKLVGDEKKVLARDMGDWIEWRRDELIRQCADNVVWEEGTMKVQGWETMNPGMNLILTRGALRASYYMESVSHEYRPFKSYTCTVQVSRGTGFIERMRMAGSPYLAEGRRGAHG